MAHEEGYWRYFAGLALFLFSMLGIVLANNFVMMFIFWELVGVSSYILIGHYYGRASAAEACKQAFIVNRIGDFGFMLGILMLWHAAGSVVFGEVFAVPVLESKALSEHRLYPGVLRRSWKIRPVAPSCLAPEFHGRSHPVSSLPCGDDGGGGGLYAGARLSAFWLVAPIARDVIAWVGALTCLAAALMATQQNDIKRILAYSTISQLGYMVLGAGVAPVPDVPMFHLFTHAFFKCLLFLCAGRDCRASSRTGHLADGRAQGERLRDFCMPYRGNLGIDGLPGIQRLF